MRCGGTAQLFCAASSAAAVTHNMAKMHRRLRIFLERISVIDAMPPCSAHCRGVRARRSAKHDSQKPRCWARRGRGRGGIRLALVLALLLRRCFPPRRVLEFEGLGKLAAVDFHSVLLARELTITADNPSAAPSQRLFVNSQAPDTTKPAHRRQRAKPLPCGSSHCWRARRRTP